ncbi:MAG: hypothetical protein ACHWZW_06045 [Spirulina sp.]
MFKYKPIATLTLNEARVLLEPDQAETILGISLSQLPDQGETRLIDALTNRNRPLEFWEHYLTGLYVEPLDINKARWTALARIPGLSSNQISLLINNRPFFSLEDLNQDGSALATVAQLATPYLMHPGYVFIDKPRNRIVQFSPQPTGILVRYRLGSSVAALERILESAGLQQIAQDFPERLLACRWQISPQAQWEKLHLLKQSNEVETLAPFLEDTDGRIRLLYPDRLDLTLYQSQEAIWQKFLMTYELTVIERYAPDYQSVRIKAHPHDLGALYRTLQLLAIEPEIRFVEPTYWAVDI